MARRSPTGSIAPGLAPSHDLLGVNELHSGQCRSLVQVVGLRRSHMVHVGRRGCCIYLLYHLGAGGQVRIMVSQAAELVKRPFPCQYWATMGRGMIHLVSVVVRVRPVGLLGAGVAVTVAVSGRLIRS
jgi:hypothetical protein